MRREIRDWAKRWGPTVTIAFLMGSFLGQYVAPVAVFILSGNRKLAHVEVEVAGIKRRQIEQCHVAYAEMWWMVTASSALQIPEPPGARDFVESWPGICSNETWGASSLTPSWLGDVYAEEAPNP